MDEDRLSALLRDTASRIEELIRRQTEAVDGVIQWLMIIAAILVAGFVYFALR